MDFTELNVCADGIRLEVAQCYSPPVGAMFVYGGAGYVLYADIDVLRYLPTWSDKLGITLTEITTDQAEALLSAPNTTTTILYATPN